jgi:hypothetical protein
MQLIYSKKHYLGYSVLTVQAEAVKVQSVLLTCLSEIKFQITS